METDLELIARLVEATKNRSLRWQVFKRSWDGGSAEGWEASDDTHHYRLTLLPTRLTIDKNLQVNDMYLVRQLRDAIASVWNES